MPDKEALRMKAYPIKVSFDATVPELVRGIRALRAVLSYMTLQLGHDRCWLDAEKLRPFVVDVLNRPIEPFRLPSHDRMMELCEEYYDNRRAANMEALRPQEDLREFFDENLDRHSEETKNGLALHYRGALSVVCDFFNLHQAWVIEDRRSPTLAEERALYQLLPNGAIFDARLPEKQEFLRSQAAREGCYNFVCSHQGDGRPPDGHDLHVWGPCPKLAKH